MKAELPRGHEALKNFMQQTGFNRTQVKRKFQDYIAEKAGLPPAKKLQLTVKPEDFQVPETPKLLEELWQTDEIQGRMSGKCLGAEYLPKVLNQTSLWNKLRSQIMSKVASHLKRRITKKDPVSSRVPNRSAPNKILIRSVYPRLPSFLMPNLERKHSYSTVDKPRIENKAKGEVVL